MHADNYADNVQSVAEYRGAILECWIQDWWGVVKRHDVHRTTFSRRS